MVSFPSINPNITDIPESTDNRPPKDPQSGPPPGTGLNFEKPNIDALINQIAS